MNPALFNFFQLGFYLCTGKMYQPFFKKEVSRQGVSILQRPLPHPSPKPPLFISQQCIGTISNLFLRG